jgi:hypothetical protein
LGVCIATVGRKKFDCRADFFFVVVVYFVEKMMQVVVAIYELLIENQRVLDVEVNIFFVCSIFINNPQDCSEIAGAQ